MARLSARQLWLSLLAVILFAPVFVASGWPGLRPAWLADRIAGFPISMILILGLIAVFVALACWLAGGTFGAADGDDQ